MSDVEAKYRRGLRNGLRLPGKLWERAHKPLGGRHKLLEANETAAQFVRRLRVACGLSPEGLADAVGVSRGTVDRWEAGSTRAQRRHRDRLAATLGISINSLLAGLGIADTKNDGSLNVVPFRVTEQAGAHPQPRNALAQPWLPLQSQFLESVLASLDCDRSTNPNWLAAAAATARVLEIDWIPEVVLQGGSNTA